MKQKNIKILVAVLGLQLSMLALSQNAFAVNGKVIKAKGRKVLIELPVDPRLQAGDTVALDTVELRSPSSARMSTGARGLTFGGSGEIHFYSQSNGYPGDTSFNVQGRGGWNAANLEYGPIAALAYRSIDSNTSTTAFGGGGFLDYNLIPNTPGTESVYGVGGNAQLTLLSSKIAGTSTSSTGIAINGGAFYKYFLFRTDTCLRFDADLHIANYTNYSEVGVQFLAGLQSYF
jgi:hypothetical protein